MWGITTSILLPFFLRFCLFRSLTLTFKGKTNVFALAQFSSQFLSSAFVLSPGLTQTHTYTLDPDIFTLVTMKAEDTNIYKTGYDQKTDHKLALF